MLKARIMREVRNSERANAKAYRWETFAAIAAAFVLTVGALLLYTTMDRHIVRQTALMAAQSAALADLAAGDVKRYRFGDGQVFVRGSHLYVTLPGLPSPRPVRFTKPGRCRRAPRRWRPRSPLRPTNATSPWFASPIGPGRGGGCRQRRAGGRLQAADHQTDRPRNALGAWSKSKAPSAPFPQAEIVFVVELPAREGTYAQFDSYQRAGARGRASRSGRRFGGAHAEREQRTHSFLRILLRLHGARPICR